MNFRSENNGSKISHKVLEYQPPPPPYLGNITKKTFLFTASLTDRWRSLPYNFNYCVRILQYFIGSVYKEDVITGQTHLK